MWFRGAKRAVESGVDAGTVKETKEAARRGVRCVGVGESLKSVQCGWDWKSSRKRRWSKVVVVEVMLLVRSRGTVLRTYEVVIGVIN